MKKNELLQFVPLAAVVAGFLFLKNRNNSTPAPDIGLIDLLSKEFYEVMNYFEKTANGISYLGASFEKEDKENWNKGYFYKNGRVNDLFKFFLSGFSLGKIY